jgi:flagellin
MGMRINQNIAAMNSYRNLGVTEGQFSKSLEKLSSGFRINRAADDAAGLAISEKLRGQVTGLNTASSNAQNAISLVQTAEGALNESHSILQRMRELAVQSANDTNTDDDRTQIQKEVNQLSQELSRIGSTTEFNTKSLLNGDRATDGLNFQIGANQGQTLNVKIGDARGYALGVAGAASGTGTHSATLLATAAGQDEVLAGNYTVALNDTTNLVELRDSAGAMVATANAAGTVFTAKDTDATPGDERTYTFANALSAGDTVAVTGAAATQTAVATSKFTATNSGLEAGNYTVSGTSVSDSSGKVIGTYAAATGNVTDIADATKVLASFAAKPATIGDFEVKGIDLTSTDAITKIQSAIDSVSDQRSTLGAVQNRLDHTINNLGVAAENLAASESRIRDTDMAAEMMKFTRAQILSQAGTSMLAQANQAPQGVLSLLR